MKRKNQFTNFIKGGLTILISVLVIFAVVKAGSLTPPSGDPVATFYSLSEIYNFITSNTTSTAGSPALDWSTAATSTGYTLTEIYNVLAGLISADKVKIGTTYLGIDGTLAPAGTATTTDCLDAKTFYSGNSWTQKIGTMADNDAFGLTASSSNQSVTAGYYSGGALAGDANLVVGNIRKSTTLFSLTGTMYGDTDASEVCSNATAAGTLSVDTSKMLTSATYCGITGNIAIQTLSNTTTTVSAGYYASSTTLDAVDTDLATGNIKSGITIFGVAGDSNVVDTSSGNATVANIATGTIAYVDGAALTGTFDPWTPQWLQTKDDWVNSGGTTGEYILEEATWSAVTGSPFASSTLINYNDGSGRDLDLASGTVKQDTRTGLWWSDVMAVGATATTTNNSFATSTDGVRPTGGGAIGFCDALNTANFGGYNNWYLPTQKELMQAYIDGSANNLPNPDNHFWSSTEYYSNTANAWYVYLNNGYTNNNTKVTNYYVRCVRR